MSSTPDSRRFEDPEATSSPFRAAFGRARLEALSATESREHAGVEHARFEYRLLKRRGKRSADEADWNALGRKGWELVGVTAKHAAFKRSV